MMALERDARPGRKGFPRRRRKPAADRFRAAAFRFPDARVGEGKGLAMLTAGLIATGILAGALWPQQPAAAKPEDDIFVMEEEPPPPPPEPPPPPPMPEPPPPKIEPPPPRIEPPEPPPPPRFGLEEGDLGGTGDLAVAAGNTLRQEAEPEIAPPPPPLPPAPIEMDRAPRILRGATPEYPERALDRGLEGTVSVLITIDTSGAVTAATVERSAGPDLDQAALKAARATLFQPPVRGGRKMPARFRAPYEFRLE